jgi:23S rRNA (cytosine1962-C5)-methyltransferase
MFATEAFENRLRKNRAKLSKWVSKNDLQAYRVYDRDMPEFPYAVDLYADAAVLHYFDRRPQPKLYSPDADEKRAEEEIQSGVNALCKVFSLSANLVFVKRRRLREGGLQYEKLEAQKVTRVVREQGLRFLVNLSDYLDTGLFLDHRLTRSLVRGMSAGKRVLNLFAYTGSISVYAHAGGASEVVTVDMSNTYLDWARENFLLNGISLEKNPLVRADVLRFLEEKREGTDFFDLIVLDPPSFSNSKKMSGVFDVQLHHGTLLRDCESILKPGGKILFSNNLRSFQLDKEITRDWRVEEISAKTIPEDFRNEKIHKAWIFSP